MTLVDGVVRQYEIRTVLLDADCPLDDDQLQESPGVYQVSAAEKKEHFYGSDACIPIDAWRSITAAILTDAACIAQCDPIATIGLFNLPSAMKESLFNFMRGYGHNTPNNVMVNPEFLAIRERVGQYVGERFPSVSAVRNIIKIAHNSPRLATVTIDRKQGCLPGLHYDSWYSTSMQDRTVDNPRIVINFGPVPRWFLYVPVGLQQFLSALAATDTEQVWNESTPITHIKDALLFLKPPVHCLKLNPGQGYIAPTESVMHDATTRWADRSSYNCQIMGDFQWLPRSARGVKA